MKQQMMKMPWIVLATLALFAAVTSVADDKAERAAVERAVLDYVESVYEVKPELIRRSVHPEMVKLGYARRSADEDYRLVPMTFEQLVDLAAKWNADGTREDENSPKEIEILDVLNQTASAKLTASWGIDYFHLAKYDGKWMIVQVMWQSHPE